MSEVTETTESYLGLKLAFVFLTAIPFTIYNAFVFSVLWLWFIVPLGVPAIGIAWALGIIVIKNLLTHKIPDYETKKKTVFDSVVNIIANFLIVSVAWGFGAILVHWFM